jgi:hypothetical protein
VAAAASSLLKPEKFEIDAASLPKAACKSNVIESPAFLPMNCAASPVTLLMGSNTVGLRLPHQPSFSLPNR